MNSILTIRPYRHGSAWVFDDPAVGLVREPFVAGIPEIIDVFVHDIPDAERGFSMLFSAGPFPGAQACIDWVREEIGGNWYRWAERNMEGWLCPAMFKYFEQAPRQLYVRAEAMSTKPDTVSVPRSSIEQVLGLLDAGDLQAARTLVRAALE